MQALFCDFLLLCSFWIQLFYVLFLEWIHSIFSEILVILSLLLVALPHCLIPETGCSSWSKFLGCLMCYTSVVLLSYLG